MELEYCRDFWRSHKSYGCVILICWRCYFFSCSSGLLGWKWCAAHTHTHARERSHHTSGRECSIWLGVPCRWRSSQNTANESDWLHWWRYVGHIFGSIDLELFRLHSACCWRLNVCVCVCVFATCIMSMSSSSCSSIFQCTTLQTLFTIIILLQAPTLGYRNPLLFLLLLLLSFSIARCVCCRSSFDAPMIWSGSRVRLRCVQVFDDINWEQDNWITNLIYLNCNFDFYSCRISLYFQQKWKFIM